MHISSSIKPDFSDVRGKRLLIALSGGADSISLAVMLAEAREEYNLTLCAAHIDHGIRSDSGEDADFCRELCKSLDIPFHTARIDVPSEAKRNHWGLETAARYYRHWKLSEFFRKTGSDYIVTAHHMDDQAETVLMHLFRGAGIEGACGMRRLIGEMYRPLLQYRKAELVAYLRERGIGWREDSTNRVADNPRNALRLNINPELEKWYPRYAEALSRFSLSAQIESDFIDELTADYLRDTGGSMGAWLELDPPPHRAILRRAIRARCSEVPSWEQVNALEALCAQPRGKVDLSLDQYAERTGSRLYFVPKHIPPIEPVALSLDGKTCLPPLGSILASPSAPVPIRDDPMRQVLSAKALEGAMLRTRRDGDRIRPLGCGDRLLSDYFIDKKIDRPLRDAIPLVAVGSRVVWACGVGISQEAAVHAGNAAIMLEYESGSVKYYGGRQNAK